MEKVLLDTNFILSCIRKKIDFFEYLMEYEILVPVQVIDEIKKITISKKKLRFRDEAVLALRLLKDSRFEKINLEDTYVDKGIKRYAEKNPGVIVATLDEDLKKKLRKRLVIRGKKLEIL